MSTTDQPRDLVPVTAVASSENEGGEGHIVGSCEVRYFSGPHRGHGPMCPVLPQMSLALGRGLARRKGGLSPAETPFRRPPQAGRGTVTLG